MNLGQNKVFERPQGGSYLGTIIDVVDMPNQQTQYGLKDKIRILWVLSHTNNQPYLDKEGKPMTIAGFYNATVANNSSLTKVIKQILNGMPPVLNTSEEIANLLLGRSNELFITQQPDERNQGQFVSFVAGIAPLKPGQIPPPVPQGFQRSKDKPKQTSGPNPGQTSQTFRQPPAQSSQPNNVSFAAPQTQNDAF